MAQSNARQTLMAIENAQEAWSRSKGIPLLRAGYVATLADNLLLGALSPRAREQFLRGDGAELQGTGRTKHAADVIRCAKETGRDRSLRG